MNVYDFDKTIYSGDSTLDFYLFCLRRHPQVILCLPKQLGAAIRYKMRKIEKKKFKEVFYSFLTKLNNVDEDVQLFWNSHKGKVKTWYKEQQKQDDVIISASPEFLLSEISSRIGIRNLIASKVDKKTGLCLSENCYGEEKVKRFNEVFPTDVIDNFYTDSYSDLPMLQKSIKGYIVSGDCIKSWNS